MSLNNFGLGFNFQAIDNASSVMRHIQRNFQFLEETSGIGVANLNRMLADLGAGIATAGTGLAGLYAGAKLAESAGKIEQAFANVRKVLHVDRSDLRPLEDAADQLAIKFGRPPVEIANAMELLAQQGYKVSQIIDTMPSVMNASIAGALPASEAVVLMTETLKGFGINASLAKEAFDQMQVAADATNMNMKDLVGGIGRFASAAGLSKIRFGESLAFFGLAKNVMNSAEMASTGTRKAIETLSNAKKQAELKSKLNIDVKDAHGNFIGVMDTIMQIQSKLKTLGGDADQAAFLNKFFGSWGGKAPAVVFKQISDGIEGADGVTRKGTSAWKHFVTEIESAVDTNKKSAAIAADTYQGAIDRFDSASTVLADHTGKTFGTLFRPVIEESAKAIALLAGAIARMDPTLRLVLASVLVGSSLFLVLLGTVMTFIAAAPLLSAAGVILSESLAAIGAAASTALFEIWPFVLIGLAIAGVVYLIQNNVGGLGDTWTRVMTTMSGYMDYVWDRIKEGGTYLTVLWDALSEGFGSAMEDVEPALRLVGQAVDNIIATFSELFAVFTRNSGKSGPGGAMLWIFHAIGKVLGWLVGFVALLVAGIAGLANILARVALFIYKNVIAPVSDWIDGLVEKFKTFLMGFEWVREIFSSAANKTSEKPPTAEAVSPETPAPDAQKSDGKQEPTKPATAASAAATTNPFAGLMPPADKQVPFDYDKLAAAAARMPIIVNIDGEKMAVVVERGKRALINRGAGRDLAGT